MSFDLTGKVVVVTGAGKGLGRAYAVALTTARARVAVADIDPETARQTAREIEAGDGKALALHTDVSDEASALDMAKSTLDAFGRIDALVNNAGIYPLRSFEEIEIGEWSRVISVNLTGSFICARAVLPAMRVQGKGKIINISSTTVFRPIANLSHYIASKLGVVGLTRAMAVELGRYNICVNAIAPGLTRAEDIPGVQPSEVAGRIIAEQCLRRQEAPADLVGTVQFLVSDHSDFITGQTISVDGGWTVH